MACAARTASRHAASAKHDAMPQEQEDSPKMMNGSSIYSNPMHRSLSTPDLIAALTRLSKQQRAVVPTSTACRQEVAATTRLCEDFVTRLDSSSSPPPLNSPSTSSHAAEASISIDRSGSCGSRKNELTVPNGDLLDSHHHAHNNNNNNASTSNGGSLISFGNVQLMTSAEQMFTECDRRVSINSMESSKQRNLLSLQNVGRTLQRTHNHLKRTRLLHLFYILLLPIYTLLGALIFQALDGEHDDRMMELFKRRCMEDRGAKLAAMERLCVGTPDQCFARMKELLSSVDRCYREWQANNHTITHPMSDLSNAIVYAFSVYTSIGYGTISASTVAARIATVFYAALGIPLFFAFIKEEGNQCKIWFVHIYNKLKRFQRRNFRRCCWKKDRMCKRYASGDETESLTLRPALLEAANFRPPFFPTQSTAAAHDPLIKASDQRRVFVASVVLFVIYLVFSSYVYSIMAQSEYFTSFYFIFSSVALIGFGDVFPENSGVIVANMVFIVIGVVLFSMCYFILQEEIRAKAFEASRKARMSISK